MSAVAALLEIAKAQRVESGPTTCVYVPRALLNAACSELQAITGLQTSSVCIGSIWFYAQ
jgi:hypothetical protein